MESQFSKVYHEIVTFLLNILNNDEIIFDECKRVFSSIIKIELNSTNKIDEKIISLLKTCNEYILQQLWFHVFKKSQIPDLINILKKEIRSRDFLHNLWCQEVLSDGFDFYENVDASSSSE